MALFQDTFTEAADTALTSHTPSPTGTSWVQIAITGASFIEVKEATDAIANDVADIGGGEFCKSQPDPSGVDYDVEMQVITTDTGTANRRVRIHGRIVDVSNYYAVRFLPTGHASNDTQLIKNVAGTVTELATVDTGLTANDTLKLEIRDAAKKVYKNGAEILTSSDNALTAAGSAGVSCGQVSAADSGNAIAATWRWDNYVVTEAVAPGGAAGPLLGGRLVKRGILQGRLVR